jgi:hypothetical protein
MRRPVQFPPYSVTRSNYPLRGAIGPDTPSKPKQPRARQTDHNGAGTLSLFTSCDIPSSLCPHQGILKTSDYPRMDSVCGKRGSKLLTHSCGHSSAFSPTDIYENTVCRVKHPLITDGLPQRHTWHSERPHDGMWVAPQRVPQIV